QPHRLGEPLDDRREHRARLPRVVRPRRQRADRLRPRAVRDHAGGQRRRAGGHRPRGGGAGVSAHASPRPLELTVERRRRWADRAATAVVTLAYALAVAPLVSLLWTVASRGVERLDAEFLTTSMRGVVG